MLTWIRTLASRIRTWLSPGGVDQDFANELDSHLDMLTDENIRRGMPPEEASRAARIKLGGVTQLKETNRELHSLAGHRNFSSGRALRFPHAAKKSWLHRCCRAHSRSRHRCQHCHL